MNEIVGYTCYILINNELMPKIIHVDLKESYKLFLKGIDRLPTEVEFNKWYLQNKID